MADALTVQIRNRLSEIERVTRSVDAFAERAQLAPKLTFAVTLALEEILVNTISYGYGDEADHTIDVRVTVEGGTLSARVEDDARPFDPTMHPAPDVTAATEDRPIGGLGIHLIRALFDVVEYEHRAGKNVLVMRKTL